MFSDPLDELVTMPGRAGDVARGQLANPPLPLEMPEETRERVVNQAVVQERVQRNVNRVKAGDLAKRKIPSYTDVTGQVQAVTDRAGAPITNYNPRHNVGYDSSGAPVQVRYEDEFNPPVIEDAFAGLPITTDPKTGDQYKVRQGLPWQWTGRDPETAKAALEKEKDKATAQLATTLGRKLTLDERQLKREEVEYDERKKSFQEKFGVGEDDDFDTIRQTVESQFDNETDGYASPAANDKSGWFGGQRTPQAEALRAQIDQKKAAALAEVEALRSAGLTMKQRRDQVAAQREVRDSIERQRVESQLRAAGIPVTTSPESQGSQAVRQDAHNVPIAGSTPAPATNLSDDQEEKPLFTVSDDGQIRLDEARPADALLAAVQAGLADPVKAADQLPALKTQQAEIAKGKALAVGSTLDELKANPIGLGERLKEVGSNLEFVPYVSSGVQIAHLLELGTAAKRLRDADAKGETGSAEDAALVKEWLDRQGRDETFGAKVTSFLAGSVAFGGEMAAALYTLGGGLAATATTKAGVAAAKKGLAELIEGGAKGWAQRQVGKALGAKSAEFAGKAAGKAALAAPASAIAGVGRITERVLEERLPIKLSKDDQNRLIAVANDEQDGFLETVGKATLDNYIEVLSEFSGGAFKYVPVPDKVKALKAGILAKLGLDGKLSPLAEKLKSATTKVAKATAWNGVLGEVGEEYIGGLMRVMTGLETVDTAFPKAADLPAMVTAFMIPGAVANTAVAIANRKRPAPGAPPPAATAAPVTPPAPAAAPTTPAPTAGAPQNTTTTSTMGGAAAPPPAAGAQTTGAAPGAPAAPQAEIDADLERAEEAGREQAQAERAAPAVDDGANQAATSPTNDLPEPTDAQKEAGNYKVGRVRVSGLDVSIENPAGSLRTGTDASGKKWSTEMRSHYGYIRGSKGKDGDHIDIFIRPGVTPEHDGPVFVVNQNGADGAFDEHKAVLGATTEEEARQLYSENYSADAPQTIGSVAQFPDVASFRQWATGARQRRAPARTPGSRAASTPAKPATVANLATRKPLNLVRLRQIATRAKGPADKMIADAFEAIRSFGSRPKREHITLLEKAAEALRDKQPELATALDDTIDGVEMAREDQPSPKDETPRPAETATPPTGGDPAPSSGVQEGEAGLPDTGSAKGRPERPAATAEEVRETIKQLVVTTQGGAVAALGIKVRPRRDSDGKMPGGIGINPDTREIIVDADMLAELSPLYRNFSVWLRTAFDEEVTHYRDIVASGETMGPIHDRIWAATPEPIRRLVAQVYPDNSDPRRLAIELVRMLDQTDRTEFLTEDSIEGRPAAALRDALLAWDLPPVVAEHVTALRKLPHPREGALRFAPVAPAPKPQPKPEAKAPKPKPARPPPADAAAATSPRDKWTPDVQKDYAAFKRALTKAQNTNDWPAVIAEVKRFEDYFEKLGTHPDDWSRWERAKADAELAINRTPLVAPVTTKPLLSMRNIPSDLRDEATRLGLRFDGINGGAVSFHDAQSGKDISLSWERTATDLRKAVEQARGTDAPSKQPAAAQPPVAAPGKRPLTAAEQEIKGIMGDLLGASSPTAASYTEPLPRDLIPQLMPALVRYAQEADTPERLAASLLELGTKAPRFSQSFWKVVSAFGATGPETPDWAAIYGAIDAPAAAPETATPEAPKPKSATELAQSVAKALATGPLDRRGLTALAQDSGLTPKQVDEAAELGIVLRAREIVEGRRTLGPGVVFDALRELYERQPNLTSKTSTSKVNQAYSTPAPLAFALGHSIDLAGATIVYEPTAGNGLLTIAGKAEKTVVNEIDTVRRENLETLGFLDVTADNAIRKDAPKGTDREIMNPPFGTLLEGGEKQQFPLFMLGESQVMTPNVDQAIVLKALEGMAADGKAGIIIGGKKGTADERRASYGTRVTQLPFFKYLYDTYNVVDHFTVAGELYEKQGAGWPVDIIIVDGKKKSALPYPFMPAATVPVLDSWAAVRDRLLSERSATQPNRPAAGDQRPVGGGGPAPVPDAAGGATGSGGGAVPRPGRPKPAAKPAATSSGGAGGGVAGQPPESVGSGGDATGTALAPEGGSAGGSVQPAESAVAESGERPVAAGPIDPENSLQSGYAPRSGSPSIAPALTPVNLLEPQRLALDDLEKRRGKLDDFVLTSLNWIPNKEALFRVLDGGQVDAVALALDNVMRGGALITGDQTGMGKGRVAAAVLAWAQRQGHIPVFMTKNDTLYKAMAEDFVDIGADFMRPFFTNVGFAIKNEEGDTLFRSAAGAKQKKLIEEITTSGKLPGDSTVIFTTYDQLKGDEPEGFSEKKKERFARKKKRVPRADGMRMRMFRQLAPRMMFVLDESHMAAGDSDTGYRMMQLLMGWDINNQPVGEDAKPVGVYYSSATFAKRADNMPIYAQTDLGKAVQDPKNLPTIFAKGGIAMQQVVSAMLARAGQYIRREMDFSGINFNDKVIGERAEQWAQADQFTTPLRDIVDFSSHVQSIVGEINTELLAEGETIDGNLVAEQLAGTEFADQLHNMVNQYLLAVKAKAVGEQAVEMLSQGIKPVITVENTMEGPYSDTLQQGFEPNFRGLLDRYLSNALNVTRAKMDGTKVKERLKLAELRASTNPAVRKLAADLQDEMDTIRDAIKATKLDELHISPIDTMREVIEAGGFTVGEITGRKTGVRRDGKLYDRPAVDTKATGKNRILSQFNNGGIDAMILNRSGSTGISAHNAAKFKDNRPRKMLVAQPNADISEMMQMYGRINRKGQITLPEYFHLASQIAAELRVLANLKRKLRGLKANTTSNTEGSEKTDVPDLFNNYGDMSTFTVLENHPEIVELLRHTFPGGVLPPRYSDEGEDNARKNGDFFKKVSGEINVLPAAWQQMFYDEVDDEFRTLVNHQTAIGENELIVESHDYRATATSTELLSAASGETEFEGAATIETLRTKAGRLPLPLDEVFALAEQNKGPARAAADAWKASVQPAKNARIAELEAKNGTKDYWPAQRQQINDRLDREEATIENAFALMGRTVMVSIDGGAARGVVTDLKVSADHPLKPSKQMVVVHINTSKQKVAFPASMIAQKVTEIPRSAVENNYDQSANTDQVRHVATGNLVAAFEALETEQGVSGGKVITFTMADGAMRQGILLPLTYNPGRAMVPIRDAAHLFDVVSHAIAVRTPSGVEIRNVGRPDAFEVRVPASRQKGGKFWREKKFTDLMIGKDMVARGSDMVGSLPKAWVTQFHDLLVQMGEKLRYTQPPPRAIGASAPGTDPIGASSPLAQTQTPEFRRWFGASKVVDADGKPLVVYHGTRRKFDAFDDNAKKATDFGFAGRGFYFTPSRESAEAYAGTSEWERSQPDYDHNPDARVLPVFLKLENPLVIEASQWSAETKEQAEDLRQKAVTDGHDGIIRTVRNRLDANAEYVAFTPTQIKSATGNSGAFDPANPSIIGASSPLARPFELASQLGDRIDARVASIVGAAKDATVGKARTALAARLVGTAAGDQIAAAMDAVRGQVLPYGKMSEEAAAHFREQAVGDAYAKLIAAESGRLLSQGGESQVLGFFVDPKDVTKVTREKMSQVLEGKAPLTDLPASLQTIVPAIRQRIDDLGEQAVLAGLLSQETYDKNKGTYLPILYKQRELDQLGLRGVGARLKLALDRFKPRTSDAFAILDVKSGKPINHKTWDTKSGPFRFDSAAARDDAYRRFLHQKVVDGLNQKGHTEITIADLDQLNDLAHPLHDLKERLLETVAARYTTSDPLSEAEYDKLGRIREAAYPVAKALLQLGHDASLAKLFSNIRANPAWVRSTEEEGFTRLPYNPRYGTLAGRYVEENIAEQLTAIVEAPGQAIALYDGMMRRWKKWKTVYNPATHGRNVLGNFGFATLAGCNPLWPSNWRYYREMVETLRGKNPITTVDELYRTGVLGGDITSTELAGVMKDVALDIKPSEPGNWLYNLLSLRAVRTFAQKAYRVEDEMFKVAAYLKYKDIGMTPDQATAEVRQWFPFYDNVPKSGTMKTVQRTVMPFASFTYESLRIGNNALRRKPMTLAALLAVPSLITTYSIIQMGLSDDDADSVTDNMRGKMGEWPVFSALIPWKDDKNRPMQWDLTNTIPYADLLGKRIDRGDKNPPWWEALILKLLTGNPFSNIAVGIGTNEDPYSGRALRATGMTGGEIGSAVGGFAWKTLAPPLLGTTWSTVTAPSRYRGSLEKRNTGQAILRASVGVDVRNAAPSVAKMIADFRKEQKLPDKPSINDSTPISRSRERLYNALINNDPDSMATEMRALSQLGAPIRSAKDAREFVQDRHPLRSIRLKDRARFMQQLAPIERQTVLANLNEYQRILAKAPAVLLRHRAAAAPPRGVMFTGFN